MIGRVYRGGKVGGLLRYLYGPGRHNEHENPRLVAAWDCESALELATLEPEILAGADASALREYGPLTGSLELATALRPAADNGRQVWHCPLRVAPGDRPLSDGEWAQVARDVMHRTGIAPLGDPGGCRWIAVRHDEHSIHLVAVLARQDGAAARVSNDYRRVREACMAAETRYGLEVTAPADRTAATHTTRAEVEKAGRAGAVPARDWLREQVQHAAVGARDPREFCDRLRVAGVVVRERRGPGGALTGYAVGRREPDKDPILYGGGKLAPDLTLPKLQARWAAAGGDRGSAQDAGGALAADRAALWRQATEAAAQAAEEVRQQTRSADPDDLVAAGDAAAAAAEVLTAASRLIEGSIDGPLTRAARDYDRAARDPRGRAPAPSATGAALRAAAFQLARGGRARRSEAAQVLMLIAQIGSLAQAIAALRAAQARTAQAAAGNRTVDSLSQAGAALSTLAPQLARPRVDLRRPVAERPARAVPPHGPVVGQAHTVR